MLRRFLDIAGNAQGAPTEMRTLSVSNGLCVGREKARRYTQGSLLMLRVRCCHSA